MPDAGRMREVVGPERGAPTSASLVARLVAVLEQANVPHARQEARDIVATLLEQPRFWPALNAASPIARDVELAAIEAAGRRARGAPFPYATGRASFRHLTLDVDPRVLIPRQETEHLVELVLERTRSGGGGTAVDVGTGSGAIALALAMEGGFDRVIGTDISRDALAVAQANLERLRGTLPAAVEFREGSLLRPVRGVQARALVSNPPYIAYGEACDLPASVRDWEPALALFSANEGLAATAEIIRNGAGVLAPGGVLALEVDTRRASLVAELVATNGRYEGVSVELDLTGRERFVIASRV